MASRTGYWLFGFRSDCSPFASPDLFQAALPASDPANLYVLATNIASRLCQVAAMWPTRKSAFTENHILAPSRWPTAPTGRRSPSPRARRRRNPLRGEPASRAGARPQAPLVAKS